MKRINIFMSLWLFATCLLQAQDKMPQAISYQAVVRDTEGKVVADKEVGIQVEILKGSAEATARTALFTETHTLKSSKTGTVNLLIGSIETESFSSIDWGADTYFLRLSVDLTGGNDYKIVSTTQMLPVPYALYAVKAGSLVGGSSSVSKSDYTFAPVDQQNDCVDLYKALAGGTLIANANCVVKDKATDQILYYSTDKAFEFSILYLTGSDLEITAEIEGLPIREEYSPASTNKGRHYYFSFDINPSILNSSNQVSTQLIIKDKEGNILENYPFNIQYNVSENPSVIYKEDTE